MEFLFTGANGFLGRHLAGLGIGSDSVLIPWVRKGGAAHAERAPLTDKKAVAAVLAARRPQALIHLAAVSDVARCAAEPALAERINAEMPESLAGACAEAGVRFIHVSTDMVFDGTQPPYDEGSQTSPLSVYGRTKQQGEQRVLGANPEALVVRLPLLFGLGLGVQRGATAALQREMQRGGPVGLFHDERRSALHVRDAAAALLQAANGTASGLLHVAARDAISRYELGLAIAERFGWSTDSFVAIAHADLPSAEPRPADLELDVRRALAAGLSLPTVLESVRNGDEHAD